MDRRQMIAAVLASPLVGLLEEDAVQGSFQSRNLAAGQWPMKNGESFTDGNGWAWVYNTAFDISLNKQRHGIVCVEHQIADYWTQDEPASRVEVASHGWWISDFQLRHGASDT
jgi:hypothetical protein